MFSKHLRSRFLLGFALVLALPLTACELKHASDDRARAIPIQHNGRVKSLESFSRQTLELVTGKEKWQRRSPVGTLLEMFHDPDSAASRRWIKVGNPMLRQALDLSPDDTLFSLEDLSPKSAKIEALARQADARRNKEEPLSPLDREAEQLYGRVAAAVALRAGESVKVIPPREGTEWQTPGEFGNPELSASFKRLTEAYGKGRGDDFKKECAAWLAAVGERTGPETLRKARLEVRYYNMRPFEHAWIAYLLAFVALSFFKRVEGLRLAGILCLGLAVFFHSYGLVMRILVLSRPPVSNMYESMVFMNWSLMIFACVFSAIQRNALPAAVGSLISALIMIYANLLPIDPSLEVLVPVLRSNYWLTVHVLTIVSSYGAFGLAMGLGHRHLFLEMRRKLNRKTTEESSRLLYRVLQLGVLLLGIGTVLGGVWANESWGRFWGWDPKETWALITFLGYLVVIHLKHARIIDARGTALASIIGFWMVLMTWYGVNFVLGKGLHSYGQGSGGLLWVAAFLLFEILFVGLTLSYKRLRIF